MLVCGLISQYPQIPRNRRLELQMSTKRRNDSLDREKKIHKVKNNKNIIDKHRNLIYNIASSKRNSEDDESLDYELDYAYVGKNKQR